jgi:diaminopimelate epimerase
VTRVRFSKMHGAGNDVVVVDCMQGSPVADWSAFARFALDRRRGIGGDQLLLVQPARDADFFMGIRNPDGSTAQQCANGIRCFTKFVRDRGYAKADQITVETLAGVVTPRWLGNDRVEVRMTVPVLEPEKIPTTLRGTPPLLEVPLELEGRTLRVTPVSMGNPHCVLFVEDPESAPVETLGPRLERHPAFPERTNVEFVAVRSRRLVEQRTWERGTGETLACGSGACAVAVVSMLRGLVERAVTIELRGGELEIAWPDDAAHVSMTGPAAEVFTGRIRIEGE